MDLLNRLKSVRQEVKSIVVKTKKLGDVEMLPMFVSHRNLFHSAGVREGEQDFVLLMIAFSIAEKGRRLVDTLDTKEVIDMLDPLGQSKEGLEDIYDLYTAANNLSKVTVDKIEEAEKN